MSRRSVAVVQVEPTEKNRLSLRKRPNPVAEPQNVVAVAGSDESTLVREERVWLEERLAVGLEKTRNVLKVINNDSLAGDDEFDQLLEMQSLGEVLTALNGKDEKKRQKVEEESIPARVFRSVFGEEEWSELEKSDQAITAADDAELRLLRLQRQRKMLWDAKNMAIELTLRDKGLVVEQSAVVSESMHVMNVLLEAVGMNAGGKMRRNVGQVAVASPPPRPTSPVRQRQHQKKKPAAAVKDKPKAKPKASIKQKKKRGEREEDGEAEEEEEKEEEEKEAQERGAVKKAKTGKGEELEVEPEDEDGNEMEESDEVEMEVEKFDIDALLAKAKEDVEIVSNMLKERNKDGGLVIKVSNLNVPDPNCASANAGAILLMNAEKLTQCLVEDGVDIPDDCLAVERWGSLLRWWRVVNRAFAIAGIFASLNARKNSKRTTLQSRYSNLIKGLKQEKVLSYPHACTYDRLGRFLLHYPQFVFQLEWVSWADWFQSFDGDEKLIKRLKIELDDEENGAFWKRPLVRIENGDVGAIALAETSSSSTNNLAELCTMCKIDRPGFAVWQCSGCGEQFFHEMCAGYDDGTVCSDISVPGDVELETVVYCKDCLEEKELSVDDVALGIAEVKSVGEFLNAADCKFKLEKIEEDGYCCFRILEKVAKESLGWKKGSADFCRAVAKFAVAVGEAVVKEVGGDALEPDALKDLKALMKDKNPVDSLKNGLWKKLEMQLVLKGFVEMFKGKGVVINVYQSDGGRKVGKTVYSEGGGGVKVSLLQWNMIQHLDCLVKNK